MAMKVSVINFKGGVGKTTVALHLAAGISHYYQKRVLVVDIDHQSSFSVVCLKTEWGRVIEEGRTVNKIFEHFTKQNHPIPGKEIISERPLYGYPNLDIVSASLELDDIELDLAFTTSGDPVASQFIKRTLLCSWIDENLLDEIYDYIIFDCPPATKLVTQNAIAASNYYIVPVIPDAVSSRGLPHLVNLLHNKVDKEISSLANFLLAKNMEIPKSYVPSTKLGGIIISKIKTAGNSYSGYQNDHTQHLKLITNDWNDYIIKPYIDEGAGVTEAMSLGYPVYSLSDNKNVQNMNYTGVFEQLVENTLRRLT
ncbi:hypothetical protein AMS62_09755 [Bacillus sp. FJAT-18019]|nr:hypothetical protein AMS62_09755 [Bacillus sp. FJAT-18019]